MINIDIDAVGNWAERQGISYTSYIDLADHDKVYELVAGGIRDINANLAKDPNLAGSAIRRFLILHKELDADDGELTRTRKVRRGFIAERYGTLVDALYSNATSVTVEAAVVFEDGRKGKVKADLKIRNVDGPVVAEPLRKAG
jgi:long-chain acyl-CoA synthetase